MPACPSWFSSELYGKDHIENTTSASDVLDLSGSRAGHSSTTRKLPGHSLWMDLALARCSGQELLNSYTITGSPEFAPLRRFFRAATYHLQCLYTGEPDTLRPSEPLAVVV